MKSNFEKLIEQTLKRSSLYIKLLGLLVVGGIVFSGVTFVEAGEVALVFRFGKVVGATPASRVLKPGFHLHFPFIIDKVVRIPVQRVHAVVLDGVYSYSIITSITETGYALTGDNNIVLLRAQLKYKITDPVKFVCQTDDAEVHLRELATGSLTKKALSIPIDDILTEKKIGYAQDVVEETQRLADIDGIGVKVLAIELQNVQVPLEVREAFDRVTSAYVENETMRQEAKQYQERVIPLAAAQKDNMIKQAESEGIKKVAKAESDVSQFYGVIKEYRKNPLVVKERLYREKVESIINKVNDTTILPKGVSGEHIILPSGFGK